MPPSAGGWGKSHEGLAGGSADLGEEGHPQAGAGELRSGCKKSQKSEEKDGIFRKDGLFLEHGSVHTAVNPVV